MFKMLKFVSWARAYLNNSYNAGDPALAFMRSRFIARRETYIRVCESELPTKCLHHSCSCSTCSVSFSSIWMPFDFEWLIGLTSSGSWVHIWLLWLLTVARFISQIAQFIMNIPPVQNNVVQSAITISLCVVCFVFALLEILIEIFFPPVRRERRHHWRQRSLQLPVSRAHTTTPMFPQPPPPVLTTSETDETEMEDIELEDVDLESTPEEIV